ncbi:MAG: NAD(P)/FAD-dependent oxidoreductase [Sphingobacteriia bacterium]|nr:NAD(P)/FAD-dependent oxidoreductase [Sphingobacteriia bacterium]
MKEEKKILIVVGGGAAGFFCAVNAARMNPMLQVIIVEKSNKVLSKVKVSGGGRCNVTHACFEISELIKKYPRGQNFLKKAFHQFHTQHTIQWFEERGVKLKTEPDGRIFPITDSSQTIIDCLMKEANKYGVEIRMNRSVEKIEIQNSESEKQKKFKLHFSNAEFLDSDFLCIATGGYSKTSQFNWLKVLGHVIENPVPSLFTFNIPNNKITSLMGISMEQATVKIQGTKLQQQGPVLITHWGLSGPAVLKLSAFAARELADKNYHFAISVNWLNDYTENKLRDEWPLFRQRFSSQKLIHKNPFLLPQRLWQYFLQESFIKEDTRWADITSKQQNALIKHLLNHEFEVKGKTTFKDEFVTCGGIKLSEIDAHTMQSKITENVFFAGEVLDIDGITGGFNFQNAWTSGWIAAKQIVAN